MKPSAILLIAAASFGLGSAAAIPEEAQTSTSHIQKRACFATGQTFGDDKWWARDTIVRACKSYFVGTYEKGKEYPQCYNMNTSKSMVLVIGLKGKNAGSTRYLGEEECINGLTSEVDSCSRGGQTTYGHWYYRVDPNKGMCS